ncbi:MAG: SDR family NAD(P)-dependent oxidoreductase [Pseudomonadota bacterium]
MKALITGAAKGIGNALAEQILSKDGHVVSVDFDELALAAMAQKWPGRCDCRNVDLSKADAVDNLLDRLEASDPFDLVVLNAGINATGPFEEIPVSAYHTMLEVNAQSVITMATALVRDGLMATNSSMVLISSLSHAVGYPGASVYAASKDAIAIYSNSVRKRFRAERVHLMTVYPGPVKTGHAKRHAPSGADASKRMEPQELARRILDAAGKRKSELYPGLAAKGSHALGWLLPGSATKLMRRIIFDKLDRSEF